MKIFVFVLLLFHVPVLAQTQTAEKPAVNEDAAVAPAAKEAAAPAKEATPEVPKAATSGASTEKSEDNSGEYEIDYEEEPEGGSEEVGEPAAELDDTADEEAPKAKSKKKRHGKSLDRNAPSLGSAVSGTRSKNKFAPILSSETKSVYRRNGKPLDVDTD